VRGCAKHCGSCEDGLADRGCDCDWGKNYGEKMEGGEERAYIGRTRTVLVGFAGLYPVQTGIS